MIQSQAKPHPKTMAKQELEKEEEEEKKKNGTKERPNKKEVIITVYVESPSPSSASHSHQKTDQFKKIKPNQNSRKPHQMAKTGGYDRRAHLLAYAQELRTTGGSQQVQWPKSGSKPKLRVSFHVYKKDCLVAVPIYSTCYIIDVLLIRQYNRCRLVFGTRQSLPIVKMHMNV